MTSGGLVAAKPHVVCLPAASQSHISSMLKLAKLLHWKGFYVTFVNTEFNHRRMVRAKGGPGFLDALPPDFRFVTIPDGLPDSDANATQDLGDLCESTRNLTKAPFAALVEGLSKRAETEPDFPAVSCILSDCLTTYSTIPMGEKYGIPVVYFWPVSAAVIMCFIKYPELLEKGFAFLKDATSPSSGYLDTVVDWIPEMKNMRLRDFPTFAQNYGAADELIYHLVVDAMKLAEGAAATVTHTFEALEQNVLNALSSMLPNPVYAIGPSSLLLERIPEGENRVKNVNINLWEEDAECLQWLDSKAPGSVLYINFGSIAFLTPQQAAEFAMGIANSGYPFLWIVRPDLMTGEAAIFPQEFGEQTKGRSFTTEWCPQEAVLNHPSVGGFLTHSGWNSTLESLSAGIPMLCWPCFADQQTNCRFVCTEWESGLEISNDLKRDEVEGLVRELMEGEKSQKMKEKAAQWKKLAEEATTPSGSSSRNLDRLLRDTFKIVN